MNMLLIFFYNVRKAYPLAAERNYFLKLPRKGLHAASGRGHNPYLSRVIFKFP